MIHSCCCVASSWAQPLCRGAAPGRPDSGQSCKLHCGLAFRTLLVQYDRLCMGFIVVIRLCSIMLSLVVAIIGCGGAFLCWTYATCVLCCGVAIQLCFVIAYVVVYIHCSLFNCTIQVYLSICCKCIFSFCFQNSVTGHLFMFVSCFIDFKLSLAIV